ncbi:CBS domain-containing protein [Alteromonadaceae bacterium M269]|nr:CBS domain-containing protein [Alteromonadaceae bacterium M269]
MRIVKIMTEKLVTVQMDDSLLLINDIFENTNFHHLLVVESNKLVGVISDRDLFKALSPNLGCVSETAKDAATLNKKAHQIMSRDLITLSPDASAYDAIALFNQHTVSCLPVIDENQKPLGIVSWRDILRVIEENRNKRKQADSEKS